MRTSAAFARDIVNSTHFSDIAPDDAFSAWLVQKYISGMSPSHCYLVNELLNTKLNGWTDQQQIYDFLKCVIPKKSGWIDIKYFQSKKKEEDVGFDVSSIADALEIPRKQVMEMVRYFPELAESFKEEKEKVLKSRKM